MFTIKDRKYNARKVYNLLDKSFNIKEGVVKINIGNTLNHELAKTIICYQAEQNGQTFITEAIWKTGGRSDVVILDNAEIIEIIHTEKPDGHKEKTYPLPIIYIKADKILENWMNERETND